MCGKKTSVHFFLKAKEFWGEGNAQLEFLGKPFNATHYQASSGDMGYILFIGRLSDEKGVDILIKAMQVHPDIPLKIAGSGNYRPQLETLTSGLNLKNVEFLGSQYGEDLELLFNNCRFVVVPSIWHENFPYVMMEAFARGKAVIGSDKGGIPEYIIEGETGFVFPSHDYITLGSLIRKLYDEPGKAKEMGLKAKALADSQFNDEIFYQRLSVVYKKVAGKVVKKAEFSS